MLDATLLLRIFTFALFSGALLTYARYVLSAYSAEERSIRLAHSSIIISVILHAMVFYAALIMSELRGNVLGFHPGWSNILRIHTALSLIIHKLLRTAMSKVQDC